MPPVHDYDRVDHDKASDQVEWRLKLHSTCKYTLANEASFTAVKVRLLASQAC